MPVGVQCTSPSAAGFSTGSLFGWLPSARAVGNRSANCAAKGPSLALVPVDENQLPDPALEQRVGNCRACTAGAKLDDHIFRGPGSPLARAMANPR